MPEHGVHCSCYTAGPGQHRSWKLGPCLRAVVRRLAALFSSGVAHWAFGKRGRAAVQQDPRPQMGRDMPSLSQRARRLSGETEKYREDGEPLNEAQGSGRGWRGREAKEGKSKSKGQVGQFLEPAGCMMGPKVAPGSKDSRCDHGLQEHNMKPPGSGASSVRVPAFLNSLPRWLLKIQCGFQGFLRSILQSQGRKFDPTSRRSSTWPMPLPFPEVFAGGASASVSNSHLKRLVSLQVALFDWFVLGRPGAAPSDLALGVKLSSRQWTAVSMLMELVVDKNTPEFIEAGDMGRSAAKNEDHEAVLASLCRAASMGHVFDYGGNDGVTHPDFSHGDLLRCGEIVGRASRADVAKAKPLVADRITVPEKPRFDPLPHFDRRTAVRYCFPLTRGRRPEEVDEQPPNVQIRAAGGERIKLLRKLATAGMLLPVDRSSFHPGFENGMFAVVKDASRDRLVLDSRASNFLDVGQSLWSGAMASSSTLAMIYLDDDFVLLSSGEDPKDYFYQFQVNQERTARNVLKGGLSSQEFAEVFGSAPADDSPLHFVKSLYARHGRHLCSRVCSMQSYFALLEVQGVQREGDDHSTWQHTTGALTSGHHCGRLGDFGACPSCQFQQR